MTSPRATRNGFTLIEMLAVLIIAALLLGISTAALQGVTGRGGTRRSVAGLEATLSLARQHAIGQAETTYVLFVPPDAPASFFANLEGLRPLVGRGYAVYAIDTESGHGRFLTDWVRLPEGIVLRGGAGTVFGAGGGSVAAGVRIRQSPPLVGYETRDFPAVRFRGTGAPHRAEGYRVFVTEGFVEVDEEGIVSYSLKPGDARFEAEIRVSPHTGLVRAVWPSS